jgi:hypothetical protein
MSVWPNDTASLAAPTAGYSWQLTCSVAGMAFDDQTPNEQRNVNGSENIAQRAYELYLERGCMPGHDVDDWLRAEREIRDLVAANRETEDRS